jgi:DNA polymerase I-like protein with 3'-5' exonuclease and polymerase domains
MLSAFASRSGRNQPSNTKFSFGPATWLRGLIRPPPGRAIAYVDYSQQEFGIAAALSGDQAMQAAYLSGDPYLGFAKAAGAVPADATKKSHPRERERFKITVLGVQYGMTEVGLAVQLGISPVEARQLLTLHHKAFPHYWQWSEAAVNFAMLTGSIHTVFGWTLHVTPDTKPRTLANFPGQANGAEILRLACSLATESGIIVCAPVHDALLIEGPTDTIEDVVTETQRCMREAGEIVLNGFQLASDAKIIRYPDRYMDPRGVKMWDTVIGIMDVRSRDIDPLASLPGDP